MSTASAMHRMTSSIWSSELRFCGLDGWQIKAGDETLMGPDARTPFSFHS